MVDAKISERIRQLRHDFRQPVNVLRLTSANLRSRLVPALDVSAATYLVSKLDRIEKQADRLESLINELGKRGE